MGAPTRRPTKPTAATLAARALNQQRWDRLTAEERARQTEPARQAYRRNVDARRAAAQAATTSSTDGGV